MSPHTVLGYINPVDGQCESYGESHAVVGHTPQGADYASRPVLACGGDASAMPWSLNPRPRTQLCKRCRAAIAKATPPQGSDQSCTVDEDQLDDEGSGAAAQRDDIRCANAWRKLATWAKTNYDASLGGGFDAVGLANYFGDLFTEVEGE